MTFQSMPLAPREVKATEAVLERVYNAARLGLKGDKLAMAAGLLPFEYNRLAQQDPVVELAALKGLSDGEMAVSSALHEQALSGDVKAATNILRMVHKWQAPQDLHVRIDGKISISQALIEAESRVIQGTYAVVEHTEPEAPMTPVSSAARPRAITKDYNPYADADLLSGRGAGADGAAVEPAAEERPTGLRDVRVPVGEERDTARELRWSEALAARRTQ